MSPKEATKKELEFETSYAMFIDSEMCNHLNTEANDLFFKALRATHKAVCPAGVEYDKLFSKFIVSEECGELNVAFNTVFYKATCEAHKSAYAEGYDEGRLAGYDEGRPVGYEGYSEGYNKGNLDGCEEGHSAATDDAYEAGYYEAYSLYKPKTVVKEKKGLLSFLRRKLRGGIKGYRAGRLGK